MNESSLYFWTGFAIIEGSFKGWLNLEPSCCSPGLGLWTVLWRNSGSRWTPLTSTRNARQPGRPTYSPGSHGETSRLEPTRSYGHRLPVRSIVSPERLPKRLGISRWQIVSSPKVSKSSIICSQRDGFSKTPQLDISRLAASWPVCRLRPSVTACIPTEYATDTENPPVCGGSFLHSFLGLCAIGRSRASSRETLGNIHVAPKDSHTVAWTIGNSQSTSCIRCLWH